MEAIVLAGGLGTRLQSLISDVPKPMAQIGNQPFLYYILKWLEKNAIKRVILSVGYKWEVIYKTFKNNFNSIELVYSIEEFPLGTGGAIALAMNKLKSNEFFIINGDTFFDTNLRELASFQMRNKVDFSIMLKPMQNFNRYGTVELGKNNQIISFHEKEPKEQGLINGGIYFAKTSIQSCFPNLEKFSFEKDFMEAMVNRLPLGGLIVDQYFIDIGIPEDYLKAQQELPLL